MERQKAKQPNIHFNGNTTHSITTFSITTLSMMTLSIKFKKSKLTNYHIRDGGGASHENVCNYFCK
jgi:hypothetical protein